MQSPSSLIFLVLLGVWAAYFVQYWVRRRDHVATARSVEQFSEAMRVLERRDPLPRTDFSEPAPRSYAVHPARAARPQVLVKRAVAMEAGAPGATGVTERIADLPDSVAPVAASAVPSSSWSRTPSVPSRGAAPVRRSATVPARRVRPSRRVRGLLLLAAVAELLVIAPLVALSRMPLWALVPALLAVGWAVAFVRAGVRLESAARRAHSRRQADLARRRTTAPVVTRTAAATRAAGPTASARPAVAEPDAPEVPDAPPAAEAESELADPVVVQEAVGPVAAELVEPVEAGDVMVPILDEDDIPLTWDPVPVPRPTYTMKAKAPRPEVAPAAVTPDPVPVARESDESYHERRVAGA